MANVSVSVLAQRARPVPLRDVKVGEQLRCDRQTYKIFRFMRAVNTNGWVAVAVARDPSGGFGGESVALVFATRNETVWRLDSGEVS